MTAIANVTAGADVLESWGDSVADALNGAATLSAATGNITTTQTMIVSKAIAANTLSVGDVYHVHAMGVCTSNGSNVVTIRVRVGSTTLTGNIACAMTPTATGTASADPFSVDAYVTVRSTGGSGTVHGGIVMVASETQPFAVGHRASSGDPGGTNLSTVVLDTTATKLIELTAVTGAGGTSVNFLQASITKLKP